VSCGTICAAGVVKMKNIIILLFCLSFCVWGFGLLLPSITLLNTYGNTEKHGERRGMHPDKNGYSV
jgi:hypothetical protein